jgi:hypothetical protein
MATTTACLGRVLPATDGAADRFAALVTAVPDQAAEARAQAAADRARAHDARGAAIRPTSAPGR